MIILQRGVANTLPNSYTGYVSPGVLVNTPLKLILEEDDLNKKVIAALAAAGLLPPNIVERFERGAKMTDDLGEQLDNLLEPMFSSADDPDLTLAAMADALTQALARVALMTGRSVGIDRDHIETMAVKALRDKIELVDRFFKEHGTPEGRRKMRADAGLREDRRLAELDAQVAEPGDDMISIITGAAKRGAEEGK